MNSIGQYPFSKSCVLFFEFLLASPFCHIPNAIILKRTSTKLSWVSRECEAFMFKDTSNLRLRLTAVNFSPPKLNYLTPWAHPDLNSVLIPRVCHNPLVQSRKKANCEGSHTYPADKWQMSAQSVISLFLYQGPNFRAQNNPLIQRKPFLTYWSSCSKIESFQDVLPSVFYHLITRKAISSIKKCRSIAY